MSTAGLFSSTQSSPLTHHLKRITMSWWLLTFMATFAWAHPPEPCVNGFAGPYACNAIDMERRVHIEHMGGTVGVSRGSDIWGWTDPQSGREFALVGMTDQTSFVEVTDPKNPVYLGSLKSATNANSVWRDVKTYSDHAFIVADFAGDHGMQIFDLTLLLSVSNPPVAFRETARYRGFQRAHNIVINEDTAMAYAVGSETCGGGLHLIDISTPSSPTFTSCFADDGYTHDAQCLSYEGPDPDYTDSDICFNYNTDTLTIVDVTDTAAPTQIARQGYVGNGYTHQGWATEDQHYLLLDDETDEQNFGHNTKTYIWDIEDLDNPTLIGFYLSELSASDHNLYIRGSHAFLANYSAGLRILDIQDIANANLSEVASFDTNDSHNDPGFDGAWSNYPYFSSGTIVVSDRTRGLFVLRPTSLCQNAVGIADLSAVSAGDQQIDLSWTDNAGAGETYNIYRSFEGCPGSNQELIATGITGGSFSDTTASGSVQYSYDVRKIDAFSCETTSSNCASATTSGQCTAPPVFETQVTVNAPAGAICSLVLDWNDATSNCGAAVEYSVYQTQTGSLGPAESLQVASGLAASEYSDVAILYGGTYQYFVVAEDPSNQATQLSSLSLAATPIGLDDDISWSTGAEVGDPGLDSTAGLAPVVGKSTRAFAKHAGWHLSDFRANSGTRSFYSQYSNDLCSALVTESLQLTAGETPSLSFWTVYDVEADVDGALDGGTVEISADGVNWEQLSLSPDYPAVWQAGADACGYDTGTPSFAGQSLTWAQHSADLSPWNGQEVELRWNFSTDSSTLKEGWYVDDIEVTHVQLPSSCSSPTLELFNDDFESGDLGEWSASTTNP